MMVAEAGPVTAAREMRKHVAWYIKGLPNSARVRENVNHARTAEDLGALLAGYLETLAAEGWESLAVESCELASEEIGASG